MTVALTIVGVVAGGIFTYIVGPIVTSWLNRSKGDAEAFQIRAEAGKTIGESYEGLLDRLERTIHTQGEQMQTQAAEIRELRTSVDELRVQAARFKDVPNLLPMADFMSYGLMARLNDAISKDGIHVSLYVDDIDGRVALGWRPDPVSDLPIAPVPPSVRRSRSLLYEALVSKTLETAETHEDPDTDEES